MKFLYEYKTKDNETRSGEINLPSRDAVYRELKKQGIRPGRVTLAPGVLNRILSLGKRTFAIVVLAGFVVAAALVIRSYNRTIQTIRQDQSIFDSPVRRQIIGDAAVIEKGIRTGWADVFASEGDRFLASFAIPGVVPAVRNSTEDALQSAVADSVSTTSAATSIESRQIIAIVAGMKEEARQFLADGGTLKEYCERLCARQSAEVGYFTRAKNEIETMQGSGLSAGKLEALWEKRNRELRLMGIKTIPLSDEKYFFR